MDIKEVLLQWFINFLIKKLLEKVIKTRLCQTSNQQKKYTYQLLENSGKKVQLPFINNIWGADLPDMQLISKFNKVNIYRKHAQVISLKEKKGATITNAFQKSLKESNRKPHYIWVDIGSDFIIKQ